MSTLDQIAIECNTDKASWGHNYTLVYDCLLPVDAKIIVEIGLGTGASARMWRAYYPKAAVYIVEKEATTLRMAGVTIIHGLQQEETTWAVIPENVDWIIDDGSHIPAEVIATFALGWPHVRKGGLYIIEDTHCNFVPEYSDRDVLYPWVFEMIEKEQRCDLYTGDYYKMEKHFSDIFTTYFYKSLIVFQKRE